jgi:hypothetical protein
MKKFSFTCLSLLIFCVAGYSQKTAFGIKAGMSSNYLRFSIDGEKQTGEKTGVFFGFVYNVPANKHFAVQPNLLATMRGAYIDGVHIKTWNIELPINLLYTHGGFFAGGGPNFSYSLDARARGEDVSPDGEVDMHTSESNLQLKRTEIGANLLAGYTFPNGFSISANYLQGFNNMYVGTEGYKVRSSAFGFALGYMFGKKPR